jgi:hypothetical protein
MSVGSRGDSLGSECDALNRRDIGVAGRHGVVGRFPVRTNSLLRLFNAISS